jgi:hypothetical protein
MNTKRTNRVVSEEVHISQATLSKLRTGGRLPSIELLMRLIVFYDLDPMEAMRACVMGRAVFAAYIRVKVFNDPRPRDGDIVARVTSQDIVAGSSQLI